MKTPTYPVIPILRADANNNEAPYRSDQELQQQLGYPKDLPEQWRATVLEGIAELRQKNRAFRLFLDSCVQCGACTDKCHYFLGGGDALNMPVARQNLLRSVYRRYFTWSGRFFPWLVGARDLDRAMLDTWYQYFHQCSECRRCAVYCPVGIDTAEITRAGRELLSRVGYGQKHVQTVIHKASSVGNNLGMAKPALQNTLSDLEEDLLEETGQTIEIPLDRSGAEILLVVPSADFFAEPHVDGLLGVIKVLHACGADWTLSSHASEAANFGLFQGNDQQLAQIATRIVDAAVELGVRQIVFGECGHAWRVAYNVLPGLLRRNETTRHIQPQHIVEYSVQQLRAGRLTLDSARNEQFRVSFHDSCNVARGSSMGSGRADQFDWPRELLRAACEQVYEMPADSIREQTFCCGGGGGVLGDEMRQTRIAGATPRVAAFSHTAERHQLTHLVAICAICKTQLSSVFPEFGLQREQVVGLHQLVGNAVVYSEYAQNTQE